MRKSVISSLVLAWILGIAGCGGTSDATGGGANSSGTAPAIASFAAAPLTVTSGGSATLAWNVTGATSLSIDHGVGAVSGSTVAVTPAATTTYTLTATNGSGSSTASATITVSNAAGLTYSITGTVAGAVTDGVTISLSGAASATTTTDASGTYTFTSLSDGAYVVAPSRTGCSFDPASRSVTVNGSNVGDQNFMASVTPTHSVSGAVTGLVSSGVTVTLSGAANSTTTTDASGKFSFDGLSSGSYTVAPSLAGGYVFAPASSYVTVNGADVTGLSFTDTGAFSISGTVSGTVVSGMAVSLTGARTASTLTDASGHFSFTGLTSGGYVVTPSSSGYTFSPANASVTVSDASVVDLGFASTPLCSWQQTALFDLTSKPAASTTNNGAIGGASAQAVASVYGRTAWYQSSDWNTLYVPMGLSAADDVFATEADFYVPAGTAFELAGGLGAFETDLGGGYFSHGVSIVPVRLTSGTYRLDWKVRSGQTETTPRSTPIANFTGQWHKLRLEGIRSTCRFRALIDGTQVDSWSGTCDLAGATTDLRSWSAPFGSAVNVAWSNLAVFKGSRPTCLP